MGLSAVSLRRRDSAAARIPAYREEARVVADFPKPVAQRAPIAASVAASGLFLQAENAGLDGPILSREEKIAVLAEMNERQVRNCTLCKLCEQRSQTVYGEGDVDAPIFFIGEGPGEVEDRTGRPFVGPAGQKLDEMIFAMGLERKQVYIANIVKCRPPGNRVPLPDEVDACSPFLRRQIEIVRPKVIVTLGLPATKHMTNTTVGITRLRGTWHEWRGIKLMPTFHPAYILRNYTVETRRAVWSDLQKVMAEVGLPPKKNATAS